MSGYLGTIIEQARRWDLDRPRSAQSELGWSELAGCRSYMGFRVRGEWATDDEENWRAIAGTGLHAWLTEVRSRALRNASFDLAVEYGGVRGHVDEVDWGRAEVTDYKFPSKGSALLFEDAEVLEEKFIQVHGYAAAILAQGLDGGTWKDREVLCRLLVCPVNGTFDDWRVYERPFDREAADSALLRYAYVRNAVETGEDLPKDKPFRWCEKFCEFFSACRDPEDRTAMEVIRDPEMATAIEEYGLAREAKSEAEHIMDDLAPLIRGVYGTARGWKVRMTKAGAGKLVPDEEAMLKRYADDDVSPPMRKVAGAPSKLLVSREKK